jgi:hypothetical protein
MIPYAISIKYLIAGYAVIFFVILMYLANLLIRWQRLKRDLQLLKELQEQR